MLLKKTDAEGAEQVELSNEAPADSTPTNGTDKTAAPRERKQRGPPEDGVPSKTKVMVANLPYDLKEDKLLEIFKDYSPTQAKIALRPIPRFMVKKLQARGEPRKGRGFGFVTLGSEELQQKACSEMNGKEIEGREIAVKVAIDSPGKEDDHMETPAEGEAATTATTGAAAAAPAAATTAVTASPPDAAAATTITTAPATTETAEKSDAAPAAKTAA
jgi:RNA recognition motif-containing protein